MLKSKVLSALGASEEYVSGGALCRELGVSRAAVWKAVEALRADGYVIASVSGKGHRLISRPDILSEDEIRKYLKNKDTPLYCFESLDSTMRAFKDKPDAPGGAVAVADRQTGGRGRMGRGFYSPGGVGLYMSILFRPELPPARLMPFTVFTAVAVSDAIEKLCGFRPDAKWPNDLLYEGKKLCGILTEMSFEAETGFVKRIVVGMGVNVGQDAFPEELSGVATSLRMCRGAAPPRAALCAAIIEAMSPAIESMDSCDCWLEKYRASCVTVGSDICVVQGGTEKTGKAVGVDGDGALLAVFDGGVVERVNSGEVTLKKQATP